MKIQLDYDAKIITLEDNVNLGDFFEKIKKILPDFKKWKLETKTVINWNNPITIPYIPSAPYPYTPHNPYRWYGSGSGTVTFGSIEEMKTDHRNLTGEITSGTYCLEVN